MNILPLVCAILFALVLMNKSLVQDNVSSYWEETSLSGFMNAQRAILNKREAKRYQRATASLSKSKEKKQPKEKAKKDQQTYQSRREARDLHQAARLNIYALVSGEKSVFSDKIYNTTLRLLTQLYGHAPFFREAKINIPDLEQRLLDQMIESAKKKGKVGKVSDLQIENPLLDQVFQKMVRGTNRYFLNEHSGYPALATYLTIQEKQKPILFCFASKQLLEAFFDETLSNEILLQERKKWEKDHKHHSVTEKELKAMLSHHPKLAFQLSDLSQYMNFSNRSGPRSTVMGTDKDSGINVSVGVSGE